MDYGVGKARSASCHRAIVNIALGISVVLSVVAFGISLNSSIRKQTDNESVQELKRKLKLLDLKNVDLATLLNSTNRAVTHLKSVNAELTDELSINYNSIDRLESSSNQLATLINGTHTRMVDIESTSAGLLNQTQQTSEMPKYCKLGLQEVAQNLTEMRQHMQRSFRTVQYNFEELNTTFNVYHTLTEIQCPSGYKHNPYANTCLRLVKITKSWQDAQTYCRSNGEQLATFESLESAFWYITQRKSDPEWNANAAWVGGKRDTNGAWRWYGKSTRVIDILPWGTDEPSGRLDTKDCIFTVADDHKFTGGYCSSTSYFTCEK